MEKVGKLSCDAAMPEVGVRYAFGSTMSHLSSGVVDVALFVLSRAVRLVA